MKLTKKLVALVLALAMVFAFAACAKKTEPAPAAAAKATIKIGGSGPLTGPAAIYGIAVKNAAEIAVAEINAKGGLQFELNFQDDVHDAETAVNAYNNLMDWGMQLMVGTVTTAPCLAVAPNASNDNVFMLTPSASDPTVTKGNTNVFQMCFSDPNQGVGSADYIADNLTGSKVAVIYNNGDAYSTGIYNKFASEAEAKGITVVYTGTFTDSSATDFSTQLTAAQQAGADLLFLPIYYTPISLIMAQARDMNYSVKYFGVDGMDGLLDLEGFDKTLAEGAYLLTPFAADAEDELTKNFVAAYKAKFNETPNQFAADSYDCVYAIYDALTKAGVKGTESASEICDILSKTFGGDFTFSGLTGENMTWDAGGEVSKLPKAVIIENGAYKMAK